MNQPQVKVWSPRFTWMTPPPASPTLTETLRLSHGSLLAKQQAFSLAAWLLAILGAEERSTVRHGWSKQPVELGGNRPQRPDPIARSRGGATAKNTARLGGMGKGSHQASTRLSETGGRQLVSTSTNNCQAYKRGAGTAVRRTASRRGCQECQLQVQAKPREDTAAAGGQAGGQAGGRQGGSLAQSLASIALPKQAVFQSLWCQRRQAARVAGRGADVQIAGGTKAQPCPTLGQTQERVEMPLWPYPCPISAPPRAFESSIPVSRAPSRALVIRWGEPKRDRKGSHSPSEGGFCQPFSSS